MKQSAKSLNLSSSDAWAIANEQSVPSQLTDEDLTVGRYAKAHNVGLEVARRILNGLRDKGKLDAVRCINPSGGGHVIAYRKK